MKGALLGELVMNAQNPGSVMRPPFGISRSTSSSTIASMLAGSWGMGSVARCLHAAWLRMGSAGGLATLTSRAGPMRASSSASRPTSGEYSADPVVSMRPHPSARRRALIRRLLTVLRLNALVPTSPSALLATGPTWARQTQWHTIAH